MAYALRNYLEKIGVITYQDFPRMPEESSNIKSIVFALSHILESQIHSNSVGTNYIELSQRIYFSFHTHLLEKALQSSLAIKRISETRHKLRYFIKWTQAPPHDRLSSFSYIKTLSRPASNSMSHSASVRSQSTSVKSEARQLLNSYSSKPLMYTNPSETQKQHKKSPFDRLHEQACKKEFKFEKNRTEKIIREMEECTFRPKILAECERTGNVFERLHHSATNRMFTQPKLEKDLQECTFSPKINQPKTLSPSKVYEKLYNDAEMKRKKIMEKEMQQKQEEIFDCTFRPNLNGVNGNVYEKLYKNFQDIQRQRDKKDEFGAEERFVPKLIASESKGKYSKLYTEVKKGKVKKAGSQKDSEEVPRFEQLYALHKEKEERSATLQERFLKENGFLFRPNVNKEGERRRDWSPKMAYPMPKPPSGSNYSS